MTRKAKEPVPTRFYVEWHPTDVIEAACRVEGMKPDDGTSFWDWVQPPDHRKTQVFHDFGEAVKFALSIAAQDCFGGARIYRQEQVVVKDGRRTFIRWDDECFWDLLSALKDDIAVASTKRGKPRKSKR